MIKISPIRTIAVAAALTVSSSAIAQKYLHRQQNKFSTEQLINIYQAPQDEFVSQAKTKAEKAPAINYTQSRTNANLDFEKAVNYYNSEMNEYQRYDVTQKTYNNLEQRLYKMEKAIDQAFIECEAYKDINIVPRWHYRYYPNLDDKLLNFDIEEIRTRTSADMESLHQLKDKIEYIMEEANGDETHTEPSKTEYDINVLAQKHLGMSYEEFTEQYKDELEFCKTVTYADLTSMNPTQRMVYSKAKAYAKEMLTTTINEAHTVNWDTGERKVEETMKTTSDMYTISEFEDDGITDEGLNKIQSGIMYKAFEEALISKYNELNPTEVKEISADSKQNKPVKRVVKGSVLIFNPDGTIYDTKGNRIK